MNSSTMTPGPLSIEGEISKERQTQEHQKWFISSKKLLPAATYCCLLVTYSVLYSDVMNNCYCNGECRGSYNEGLLTYCYKL